MTTQHQQHTYYDKQTYVMYVSDSNDNVDLSVFYCDINQIKVYHIW